MKTVAFYIRFVCIFFNVENNSKSHAEIIELTEFVENWHKSTCDRTSSRTKYFSNYANLLQIVKSKTMTPIAILVVIRSDEAKKGTE